jgi:hypothetical protein
MKMVFTLGLLALSSFAIADRSLPSNGKAITCEDGEYLEAVLNAARTTVKLKIHGKNEGTLRVTGTYDDGEHIGFETSKGTLVFSDVSDMFLLKSPDMAFFLDCQ